ncbi:sulfotransferase [Sphingomicrobium sp. B8]|uniref:Sulfotransferase n=1 Tax=Sphingomicrobium clamense TaxID=2851013 RepID=A0ABS6V4T1_9SPHN|nr:sulfotransferase [Sphingomicrobium sp. B8]
MIDGSDEVDAFTRCLLDLPTPDHAGAMAYQSARVSADPWGDVARTYHRLLNEHFGSANSMLVDKTLLQSHLTGLLHAMPDAKIVWMRRTPEDVAWSCFKTLFVPSTPWSWQLEDIAHFMKLEDQMFRHWTTLFPDRIYSMHYEQLVRDPDNSITLVLKWLGLDDEEAVHHPEQARRYVKTASLVQVQQKIEARGRLPKPSINLSMTFVGITIARAAPRSSRSPVRRLRTSSVGHSACHGGGARGPASP